MFGTIVTSVGFWLSDCITAVVSVWSEEPPCALVEPGFKLAAPEACEFWKLEVPSTDEVALAPLCEGADCEL